MNDFADKDVSRAQAEGMSVDEDLIGISGLVAAQSVQRRPLSEDPTARMLGLVPDNERALDAAALRRLRMRAKVGVADLAQSLRTRGWSTKAQDVLAWEAGNSSSVPPALIAAIADELGIEPGKLSRQVAKPSPSRLESLRESGALQELITRIAKSKSLSEQAAFALLERSQPSFAFRGTPDDDQFLRILDRFVAELETD